MKDRLVSCLCVTRDRVPLLRRAVACFQAQTYQPCELVILFDAGDLATREYVASLQDPSIFAFAMETSLPLGALRNRAVEHARGHFIAQWDDDDWYAPARLAMQIDAIEVSHLPACVLARVILYDSQNELAYLSEWRTWEGSLVAQKAAVPAYPELGRAEDTPVIDQFNRGRKLVHIERPELYVYTFHGANTWNRAHWEKLLKGAQQLTPLATQEVQRALKNTELESKMR